MLHIFGKLVEAIGFTFIAFIGVAIIFEGIMWVIEKVFDDE